jgi:hypothetical protein
MYICLDCGEIFEEPETWEESYPYGEGYAYQTFSCCPHCEGSYEEAEVCKDCGEYFAPDDLYDGMCNECREWIRKEVATLIAKHFPKSYFDNFPDDTFDNIWEDIENAYNTKEDK